MSVRPRNGRRMTSAIASPPLSASFSPEYRGEGAICRRILTSRLCSGETRRREWRFPRRIGAWLLTTMPYDPKDIPPTLDVKNAEVRLYHMWAESLVGVETNDT